MNAVWSVQPFDVAVSSTLQFEFCFCRCSSSRFFFDREYLIRRQDLTARVLVGMPTRYLLTAHLSGFPHRLARGREGGVTIQAFLVPTLFKETQMTKLRI